jgi:DNA invertase Pin-like site-specific DNA recombinase
MHEKIAPEHLKRLAVVYIRQSTPGQVRNHQESYRVQKGLAERARELGWPASQITILEQDQGKSATQPGNRTDFDELVRMVKAGEVGVVLASEISRLARNNLEWNMLVHYCALVGAVLSDETQVWDPALSQDSLVLGIQGALAMHESFSIRKRMERGLREKASRGELHHGTPAGYVCVEGKHLRKHPDLRVQRAIANVFTEFERSASVYELLQRLWKQGVELPAPEGAGDGLQMQWVAATYDRVRDILQNPKYAGIYAYPLTRVVVETGPDGVVRKRTRKVPRGEWDVELHDHHPAYITVRQYEANQEKIAMNANRFSPQARGTPGDGPSLLTGLIHCRQCDRQMGVRYPSSGSITYVCRRGRRQRDGVSGGCFSFRANELEDQLVEHVLYAIRPAGIEAAQQAAERLSEERRQRRQVLEDAMHHARYEADLARRRFDTIDPANRLVFDTLSAELEEALKVVEAQSQKLTIFDRDEPARPTSEELAVLEVLGREVERVWFDEHTDGRLKKQIIRTLIRHVYVDLDESSNEVVLYVEWSGKQITELRHRRRSRKPRSTPSQLQAVMEALRKVVDDEATSRILNRARLRTERGETWTKRRVLSFRKRHGIEAFSRDEKEREGWLLQSEAATKLNISPMSVHRLIQAGILPTEGYFPGLPSVVRYSDLSEKAVQRAVSSIRNHGKSPLPSDPRQLSLFTTTKLEEDAS